MWSDAYPGNLLKGERGLALRLFIPDQIDITAPETFLVIVQLVYRVDLVWLFKIVAFLSLSTTDRRAGTTRCSMDAPPSEVAEATRPHAPLVCFALCLL